MPGITSSRYVRGIFNPHSAYASAEIPENVTIFKIFPDGRRRRRRRYPFRDFVTATTFVLMTPDAIRAYHLTKGLTFHTPLPAFTPVQFLLAQIHADPYTHECCECAVTWFITPQDYHSLPGAETRLFSDLSVFLPRTTVIPLSGLWLPAIVYGERVSLQFEILCAD